MANHINGRGGRRAIGSLTVANFVYAANTPAALAALKPKTRLKLMIPILNIDHPRADMDQLSKYYRNGDIMVFPSSIYPVVLPVKNRIDGLGFGTGGTAIATLQPGISTLPPTIEYVTYDYEAGHCPEFTSAYVPSLLHFQSLYNTCHSTGINKKLVITPAYVQTDNWDWGGVAFQSDVIVLQVQNLQTGANVPDSLKPSALGYTLSEIATSVSAAVKSPTTGNPNCQFFLQLDTIVTNDPTYIMQDLTAIEGISDVDGVALWYNPGTGSATSELPQMLRVLDLLAA